MKTKKNEIFKQKGSEDEVGVGKGNVPNSGLPEEEVLGASKIIEPSKPSEEVEQETSTTEQSSVIEILHKSNGDAVVTPRKTDGSTYSPGSKIMLQVENNTPNEITIGEDVRGEIPM